jgi:hypothetical protein
MPKKSAQAKLAGAADKFSRCVLRLKKHSRRQGDPIKPLQAGTEAIRETHGIGGGREAVAQHQPVGLQ